MGGIVGRLFREFAVRVTVAVLMSAFVSLTLTPVMCAASSSARPTDKRGRLNQMARGCLRLAVVRVYDRGLHWVLRHQFPTLLSTLVLIVVTGYLYVVIPKGFFPEQDTGFIFGQAEARQDISFAGDGRPRQPALRDRPAGSGGRRRGGLRRLDRRQLGGEHRAHVHPAQAVRRARRLGAEIIQRLRPKVAEVPGVKFFMQAGQDINVGGRLSKTQYQYTLPRPIRPS